MVGSILSVHIINAEELNPGRRGEANAIVRVEIEKQRQQTLMVTSNNPVWNEILTFDITKGVEDLKLTVEDRYSNKVIGTKAISLKILSEDPK
jgi:hypothetical protein